MILPTMIHNKKAVAYMCDGIQFIRLVQHEWNDTQGLNHTTELGGQNEGPDALGGGGMSLEAVADFFSSALESGCAGSRGT